MLDSMIVEVSILYSICYYNTLHPVFVGDITLSDTIEFNSIDEDSTPQFILTCISTGGPATTVTWTRDSVTITEGTETTPLIQSIKNDFYTCSTICLELTT